MLINTKPGKFFLAYLNAVYYVVVAVEISKQVASYNWWSTQNQVLYLGYKIPEEFVTGLVYKANECSFVLILVMLSQILFSNCDCKSLQHCKSQYCYHKDILY